MMMKKVNRRVASVERESKRMSKKTTRQMKKKWKRAKFKLNPYSLSSVTTWLKAVKSHASTLILQIRILLLSVTESTTLVALTTLNSSTVFSASTPSRTLLSLSYTSRLTIVSSVVHLPRGRRTSSLLETLMVTLLFTTSNSVLLLETALLLLRVKTLKTSTTTLFGKLNGCSVVNAKKL